MKRRKSTVLTSLIVTIAMVMSMGGYLFADETETEVIPEEPAVEETAEAPEDIEEPEVAETEDEEEAPAEASEEETSDEDVPVEESAEEAPVADEVAEEDDGEDELFTELTSDFVFDYDSDELAEQYINSVMSVNHQRSSVSSYEFYSEFTPGEQAALQCLYSHVRNIADGVESSTQITIPENVLCYTASELGVSELAYGTELNSAITSKLNAIVNSFPRTLLYSCPYELYWYDKTSGTRLNFIDYEITDDGKLWISIKFSFPVAEAYQGSSNYEVDTSYGINARNAAQNARSIINRYAGLDDYNKLLAYNNQICLLTDYNTSAADDDSTPYGNPWQLVWVFDGDPETKVVCEGYSKAFQFLCDNSVFISPDVYAISVSGIMYDSPDDTSGGGHMWNIVHMDDGNNYLVDVTNSDPHGEGNVGDRLFMVGATMNQDIYWVHIFNGEMYNPQYSDYGYKYDSKMNNVFTAEALQLSSTAYVPGSDVDDLPAFCGHALSLSGQIGLQFFVELPDGAKAGDYYVTFSDEHGHVNRYREYNLSESNKVDSSNIYMIQLNLSSIQMAEQITPKLHNRTNGDVVQGASYSVQDYINWGISATNTVTTPDEKALLTALANYGYYAQQYLSTVPGHEWTVGVDYSAMNLDDHATYDFADIESRTSNPAISSTGTDQYFSKVTFALKFGDQISLILYFTPVGDIDTNGFTVNGNPVTPELQEDGRYRITIPNISVTQIGSIFTVKYGDATVTVSPVNYINAMLNQEGNTDGKNLVCALYELGVACGMN